MWCKSVKGNSSPLFLFVKVLALLLEFSRWASVHVLTVDQHEVESLRNIKYIYYTLIPWL